MYSNDGKKKEKGQWKGLSIDKAFIRHFLHGDANYGQGRGDRSTRLWYPLASRLGLRTNPHVPFKEHTWIQVLSAYMVVFCCCCCYLFSPWTHLSRQRLILLVFLECSKFWHFAFWYFEDSARKMCYVLHAGFTVYLVNLNSDFAHLN